MQGAELQLSQAEMKVFFLAISLRTHGARGVLFVAPCRRMGSFASAIGKSSASLSMDRGRWRDAAAQTWLILREGGTLGEAFSTGRPPVYFSELWCLRGAATRARLLDSSGRPTVVHTLCCRCSAPNLTEKHCKAAAAAGPVAQRDGRRASFCRQLVTASKWCLSIYDKQALVASQPVWRTVAQTITNGHPPEMAASCVSVSLRRLRRRRRHNAQAYPSHTPLRCIISYL